MIHVLCISALAALALSCSSTDGGGRDDGATPAPAEPSPAPTEDPVSSSDGNPPDDPSVVEPPPADPSDPGPALEAVNLPPPPEGNVHSEHLVIQDVPGGEERTVCVYKRLPNTVDWKIVEIQAQLGDGSHHMMVDRNSAAVPSNVPTPCGDLQGSTDSRLLIAQQHSTSFKLPGGVAFTLPPEQVVTLNVHYINTTAVPIDVEARVDFVLAPEGTGADYAEAKQTFTGDMDLNLPPQERTVEGSYHPMEGSLDKPAHVFGLTSHTHQLGIRAIIERTPAFGTPGELLHESLDWAEPPLTTFDTPLDFIGQDGLALTCEYENTTDEAVTMGTGFFDEMCFMWVYWYQDR